jgi:recombination protein RecR
MISESLVELQKSLQNLPGIGERTAYRLAYFLVSQPADRSLRLATAITNAIDKCKPCESCFLLADSSPCQICSDQTRDATQLCIVENSKDIYQIEATKEYHGKYFVLGKLLSPVDGIGPREIRMVELNDYIDKHLFSEIILAISPSTEGETTISYISELLQKRNITVTRLSTGIPYGADMEYTASTTLLNAFKRRYPA